MQYQIYFKISIFEPCQKEKDKPDMVVDKPHAMEYPTNLGAPSFAPEKNGLVFGKCFQ